MVAATKYKFADAFDGGKGKQQEQDLAQAKAAWEEETVQREAAAYAQGKAEALASLEAQTLAQVQSMNTQLLALAGERAALQDEMAKASIELAHLSAVKIADILIDRGPGRLVAETVLNTLPLVIGEARIVVRLAEPLVDHIKSRMDEMALEAGFTGKVVLLGDERIAPGDCRIEWANGGIERRAAAVKDDISRTIRTCLNEFDGTSKREDEPSLDRTPPHDQSRETATQQASDAEENAETSDQP